MDPDTPVQFLKGVGPRRANQLARLGIRTVVDVVHHYPRRYEDRTKSTPIGEIRAGESVSIAGTVVAVRARTMRGRRSLVTVTVADESGRVDALFWNQPWREHQIPEGAEIHVTGKVSDRGGLQIGSPEFELVGPNGGGGGDGGDLLERGDDADDDASDEPETAGGEFDVDRIVPVYALTQGVGNPWLRRVVSRALEELGDQIEETMPEGWASSRGLPDIDSVVRQVHFPDSWEALEAARERLKYEELFLFEVALARRKYRVKRGEPGVKLRVDEKIDRRIRRLFPFTPTGAQDRSIEEITADLASGHVMNRLVQGDVGSGKTAVAAYAILVAVAGRHQAAFMAPTEILAEQHFRTLSGLLAHARVNIVYLGGGLPAKQRRQTLAAIASGEADIVVGTHALIQPDVTFEKLGLAVVDEQHKFGVEQRAALRAKGDAPHLLVMTATPIPRTLTLTAFGDLDVSVIDELPPGRQPVATRWYRSRELARAYQFIREEVRRGHRAYFIYPLVEETEESDLLDATSEADRLATQVFPDLSVGLLHGRMSRIEKDAEMERFRRGDIQILVSTVVVEVGVDVPEATVLAVVHAERFGLSQLHQLRGRIGRSDRESWCLLFGDPGTPEGRKRLATMVKTSDGFRIAEVDLRLRGPGEVLGTRQHGLPEFRIADIMADHELLRRARRDAFEVVAADPELASPENARIRERIEAQFADFEAS